MLHSKMLTFLGHGYDDAHCALVLHGLLLSRPSHCGLCHDLDHPYGDDLSPCLCPSPDFFLYLYQIRESDAAAKKMSRSNKQQQKSVKTGTVRQKYTLFIGQNNLNMMTDQSQTNLSSFYHDWERMEEDTTLTFD